LTESGSSSPVIEVEMFYRWMMLSVLAGILPSPCQAQGSRVSVPIVVDTLENGLTLIVHEDHSVPNVSVNIWYMVGSGDEQPGRTGFAHLFEHLMFMGSQNAEYPAFDRMLEAAGASNNGSTNNDRTNYFEEGPANSLPLMLWLEADRMGWFLPTMNAEKVDAQREVVKNERRQSYENQPYGLAWETLAQSLYPAGHPYSWSVLGSMTDLSAASLEDTRNFFRRYYAPNNAVLTVAGDVNPTEVRQLVEQYFGEIPRGPAIPRPTAPEFSLARDTVVVLEDRVQLPRLYFHWHTARTFTRDDAALDLLGYLLAGAKNSRLTQKLVYDQQLATNVVAFNDGKLLDGDFTIYATARPGHSLPELQAAIDGEVKRLIEEGPTPRELEQAQNATEASFLNRLEQVGAKADQLNSYFYFVGTPDYFQQDLARYRAVTVADIQRVVSQYLGAHRVVLSIVPQGKTEMAIKVREATP
jgi:zinc protease